MPSNFTPTVLTIAGSDTYGGAGIQVDAKTIHALGGYAFSVISAITAQNSLGVNDVYITPKNQFKAQLESILDDVKVDAIKIGMLGSYENVKIVIEIIKKYHLKNIILDTVLVSSSGKVLLEKNAIELMKNEIFPLVDLITPNIPEINVFLEADYQGEISEIEEIAQKFFSFKTKALLIKGGHSVDTFNAIDYLSIKDSLLVSFSKQRVSTSHTHGTGCVLSSAIATHLALGYSLAKSVELSKNFLTTKLQNADDILFEYHQKKEGRKEPIL